MSYSTIQGPDGTGQMLLGPLPPPSETVHSLGRLARYRQYRAFYAGDQWQAAPSPGERQLTVNYARVFVNKAASYLLGKPVGYEAEALAGADPGAEQTVEAYLRAVADFNNLGELDLHAAVSAGCLGDGAFTVRWDASARLPRVAAVDPATVEARWRADDLTTLLWVRQTYWLAPAELTAAQRARLGDGPAVAADNPYTPLPAQEEWTTDAWALTVDGTVVDGGPNPYGQIPYILFPNLRLPGEFWGESDLVDVLALQRELNGRLSIFSRILEVSGAPVTVVTGASDTEGLRLGPNRLWELPEGATAEVLKLLDAGVADAHFKYIDAIYRAMHDVTEMPRTSFGDSNNRAVARSGVALEIELQPLLHKLARKRSIWTGAFVRRAQLALAVARVHDVALPAVRLALAWPPVLPQDRAELVAQEVALVGAGIHPPTTSMTLLNDPDPAAQLARVAAERAALREV